MNRKKEGRDFLNPRDIIKERKKNLINRSYFFALIKKILSIGLVLYLVFTLIFGVVIIPNRDMFPRFSPTDLVFYYRLDRDFIQGDVVSYRVGDERNVSRIIALEGDEVDITESGLMINGSIQGELDIFYDTLIYEGGIEFPIKLKEGEVFLLGDYRDGARDSRYFGPLDEKDIEGKVFILLRRTNF